MKEDTLMKKLKALLLTVFIVLMLFASCDNGIRTLGEENIKMLSSVTEDAFAQFDTLSSGSKELKSNGYTGTATLSVENGKWSMHITGEDAEGFAIDYTITQDDVESDSTVRVKIGDVTYDASASALFSGSELPKNPLTDAELAIFKEAVNAAFGSMDYLETKNDGNFTLSDGTEGTFSITVAETSWTLTLNSAIGDSQYTLIVTDTAATLSYNNAQYSLDRSDLMTDVSVPSLPPTELEEDVITLLSSTLKEAFSKFDYLQTGKQSFDYEGYSVTANLSVTDADTRAWTMHIEATGNPAFSFTVNSDQSPITVTYDGRDYHNVTYSSLMADIELPEDPIPEELDAEQIADLKGITEAAFNAFTLLENGQASAKYETYSITATLLDVSTDRWTMNISATGEDEYTYSYAITSEKYENGTIQVTYRGKTYNVSASEIASGIDIPPLPKTALTDEELKVVNQALKDAFDAFTYLESGSETIGTITANLAVGDNSWTMSITATGSPSFYLTISNSDIDGNVDVTYNGEGPFKTSYASLMEGVNLPERKPTALTDEQYEILNGSLIAAFGNFEKLETKDNVAFSYGGFDGTANLEVDVDFSWTITLSGSNSNSESFSFTLTSADKSINVTFNDLSLPAEVDRLMTNVKLPPRDMTDDEKTAIVEALSIFNHADYMTLLDEALKSGTYTATDSSIKVTLTTFYGDVTVVFNGTRNEAVFDASGYSVSSSALTLNEDMTLVLDNVSGEFSSYSQTGGIPLNLTFILSGDNAIALDVEDIPTVKFGLPSSGSIAMSDTTASEISEFDLSSLDPEGITSTEVTAFSSFFLSPAHSRTFGRLAGVTSTSPGVLRYIHTYDASSKQLTFSLTLENYKYNTTSGGAPQCTATGAATLVFTGSVDSTDSSIFNGDNWILSADELTLTNTRVSGNTIISVDNLSGRIVKDGADDTEAATVGFRLNAEGTDYIKEIDLTNVNAIYFDKIYERGT